MPLDQDRRQGGCFNPPWATTRDRDTCAMPSVGISDNSWRRLLGRRPTRFPVAELMGAELRFGLAEESRLVGEEIPGLLDQPISVTQLWAQRESRHGSLMWHFGLSCYGAGLPASLG
jgi:hypothetical protein